MTTRPKLPIELFSVECGLGWNCLIWPLIKRCMLEGVTITQIKEKYGTLRFYVGCASDSLYAAIDDAEDLSSEICEVCGEPGRLRSGGWLQTRCDKHANAINARRRGDD